VISIVVARSTNGVIGRAGELPWRLPTDLRRFRELTTGHTVLMGRRTFESLPPRFRPLPERRNIVLSSTPGYRAEGAEVFGDLEGALDACGDGCFVIGGGVTYAEALPLTDRIYATEVEAEVDGDAFFPDLDAAAWRRVERSERIVENDYGFTFNVYERRPETLYDLTAARSEEQLRYMERLEAGGICIFCEEHFAEYHREPIEHRGEHWYVTKNDYPYRGARAHYLIVPYRHVRSFDELPDEAGAELWAIKRMLKERLGAPATAVVERSGDMRLNGGSVAHLHTHFVALDEAPEETVRFRVSAHGGAAPTPPP
jgi:dihydrofolate reductase/diadenosine tetraphosphate (Ap4A) HIT family hydrolase